MSSRSRSRKVTYKRGAWGGACTWECGCACWARGVGGLAGRLCLVLKVSSVVHLVDASPARDAEASTRFADLHSDAYWRGGEEKSYRLFLSPKRLARFVVGSHIRSHPSYGANGPEGADDAPASADAATPGKETASTALAPDHPPAKDKHG